MTIKGKLLALVKSRRFWVAVAGVAFVASDALGAGLTQEQVVGLTLGVGSWIVGDSIRRTE